MTPSPTSRGGVRYVTFQFTIPFDGGAADTCEEMIRSRISHALLNSLSSIHPDIRARVSNLPIQQAAQAREDPEAHREKVA